MVGEAVQQHSGEVFTAEDLGALVERQVGGHHDGSPLVALGEDFEEQFRTGAGERHEAHFVDYQLVELGKLPQEMRSRMLVGAWCWPWSSAVRISRSLC